MSKKTAIKALRITLLFAPLLPAVALAQPQVRDNTGALVGTVRGIEGRRPVIYIADGPKFAVLKVDKWFFLPIDIPHYTADNCTGPMYVVESATEEGLNKIQKVVYVVNKWRGLWRTKVGNPAATRNIQSRFDNGACVPWTVTIQGIAADKFVRNLKTDFPPPYTMVGTP